MRLPFTFSFTPSSTKTICQLHFPIPPRAFPHQPRNPFFQLLSPYFLFLASSKQAFFSRDGKLHFMHFGSSFEEEHKGCKGDLPHRRGEAVQGASECRGAHAGVPKSLLGQFKVSSHWS